MTKKEKEEKTFLIVLAIVLIIIIYIITFGKVNIGNGDKFPSEFKDSKEEAERKHKRLRALVNKQEALKRKLNKRFKLVYFFVRLVFVGLWFGSIFLLFVFRVVSNLSDILDWSEAFLLILLIANFLTFGTLSNLESFITILKNKIENWIFGKYVKIDEKIDLNKSELKIIENQIN